jgi:integrase
MNEVMIQDLINSAIQQLNAFHLCDGAMGSYRSRAFKPVSAFFCQKEELHYQLKLMNKLKKFYEEQFKLGIISHNTLCWRMRGIEILEEIRQHGCFKWKVFTAKKKSLLPCYYEQILSGFINIIGNIKRIGIYKYITERYFIYLFTHSHDSLVAVSCMDIKNFMLEISASRPKSMDDVVTVLRRLHSYLRDEKLMDIYFETVLFAPRARDKKVFPCIAVDEIRLITEQINPETPFGKRDFAIIQLGIRMGLRAGDIASLKLTDIDWKNNELNLVQGKTQEQLVLPLDEYVGTSLIDYILNGRPKTDSPYIFLRSIAPYYQFKDGVSVACVFRKYLKKAGISHSSGDGRTFHGLRRTFGTEMIIQGVPVTTVSQVLGHRSSNAAKQYIALDTDGLKVCALGFDSIGGGVK